MGARKLRAPGTRGVFKLSESRLYPNTFCKHKVSLRKAGNVVPGTSKSLLIMSPWEQMSDVFSEP